MFRFLIKSVFWIGLAFLVMPQIMGDDGARSFFTNNASPSTTPPQSSALLPEIKKAEKTVTEIEQICQNFTGYCDEDNSLLSNLLNNVLSQTGHFLSFLSEKLTDDEMSVETIIEESSN